MGIEMITNNTVLRHNARVRLVLGLAQIFGATAVLITWLAGVPAVIVGILVILTIGLVATSRLWYRSRTR